GLAQICLYHKLPFICVVDPKTTSQNLDILRAYGARVDLVREPDPVTGEFLQARLNRVRALRKAIANSYWPDQYSNPNNPGAHELTMSEIVEQLGRAPDYLVCATSTCGTLRGCSDFIRHGGHATSIIAVDAV